MGNESSYIIIIITINRLYYSFALPHYEDLVLSSWWSEFHLTWHILALEVACDQGILSLLTTTFLAMISSKSHAERGIQIGDLCEADHYRTANGNFTFVTQSYDLSDVIPQINIFMVKYTTPAELLNHS